MNTKTADRCVMLIRLQARINCPLPEQTTDAERAKGLAMLREARDALRVDETDTRLLDKFARWAGRLHDKYQEAGSA